MQPCNSWSMLLIHHQFKNVLVLQSCMETKCFVALHMIGCKYYISYGYRNFLFIILLELKTWSWTVFHQTLIYRFFSFFFFRFSIEHTKSIFLLSFAIPASLWIFSCSCLFGCSKMLRIEENGQMRIRCRKRKSPKKMQSAKKFND